MDLSVSKGSLGDSNPKLASRLQGSGTNTFSTPSTETVVKKSSSESSRVRDDDISRQLFLDSRDDADVSRFGFRAKLGVSSCLSVDSHARARARVPLGDLSNRCGFTTPPSMSPVSVMDPPKNTPEQGGFIKKDVDNSLELATQVTGIFSEYSALTIQQYAKRFLVRLWKASLRDSSQRGNQGIWQSTEVAQSQLIVGNKICLGDNTFKVVDVLKDDKVFLLQKDCKGHLGSKYALKILEEEDEEELLNSSGSESESDSDDGDSILSHDPTYESSIMRILKYTGVVPMVNGHYKIKDNDEYEAHAILMSAVEGKSFSAVIEESKSPSGDGLSLDNDRVIESTIEGLKKIHDCDILHRDITPNNLMVREDGQVIFLDLELAKEAVESAKSLGVGSSLYWPPGVEMDKGVLKKEQDRACLFAVLIDLILSNNEKSKMHFSHPISRQNKETQLSARVKHLLKSGLSKESKSKLLELVRPYLDATLVRKLPSSTKEMLLELYPDLNSFG